LSSAEAEATEEAADADEGADDIGKKERRNERCGEATNLCQFFEN
jgi:hypothetical protein